MTRGLVSMLEATNRSGMAYSIDNEKLKRDHMKFIYIENVSNHFT